jgi:hypothetical protein
MPVSQARGRSAEGSGQIYVPRFFNKGELVGRARVILTNDAVEKAISTINNEEGRTEW